jgi:chaperonin GroEL (HSP60 family)
MAWPRDSRSEDTPLLCFPGSDAQRLLRIDEEAPLKDHKIALLEQRVSNLEKENDLLKQQNTIQKKLTGIAKREAEAYRTAFEKEKELTDRALMLAEVGKPKLNCELQGLIGLAAFVC